MNKEKVCFVISPIGDEGSDTRKRSDLTYEYIIRPVVEKFEYHLIRADTIKESGTITSQIIDQIVESSLVIADLSDNNPNVFYELAIRHVIQKPYIQMIRSGQKIPFDITGLRTIPFDIDLKSANNAKNELFDQINSIKNGKFNTNNPITSAIHQSSIHKMLTRTEDIKPDNFSMIVLESVSELRSIVMDLRADFHDSKQTKQSSDKFEKQIINTLVYLDVQIHEMQERIDVAKIMNKELMYRYDSDSSERIEGNLIEIDLLENELSNLRNKRVAFSKSSMHESSKHPRLINY